MDNFVYNAFDGYFQVLEKVGYMKQKNINSLLVLHFFYDLIYHDFRGYISEEDYHTIELALNCLYGTNCLIPYPDYLKMGKLHLGEITELACRVKTLEETEVIKPANNITLDENNSDIILTENID